MAYGSFRQLATILGGKYSARSMAAAESSMAAAVGIPWPQTPIISLRSLLFGRPPVAMATSVTPPPEPDQPRTTPDEGYYDAPSQLLDSTSEGRVAPMLRQAAQLRDGNAIMRLVAQKAYANSLPGAPVVSQDMLTAMTQLAVTGSNAFAAWSANPTQDLTPYLTQLGMPAAAAATVNQQIMSDFNAALRAVRNPGAGIDESARRNGLKYKWIAVSSEDDPPKDGIHETVPHLEIAPMPPTSGVPGLIDTSGSTGSPILDFVENTIVTFVETLMIPFGNTITAIVGGSLGGHLALRLAASQKDWVKNVVAWSPAGVFDHDVSLLGISIPHWVFTNPHLAKLATDPETIGSRQDFFTSIWDKDTFAPPSLGEATTVAGALVTAGLFSSIIAAGAVVIVPLIAAIESLPSLRPEPQLWYRDGDWPTKPFMIEESRRDRREKYNANLRQWHCRICEEMIGFTFDTLAPSINKPLLLMVGEKDEHPYEHFFSNVKQFAHTLARHGQGCITVQDTGHSIHNERPYFLAKQVVNFAHPM